MTIQKFYRFTMGADVTEEEAEALKEKLEDKFPEFEIDLYSGGQPIYYYVMSIE